MGRILAKARIEKYYTKVIIGFIIVTALVVVAIFYFSFSRTVITVTPIPQDLKTTFTINLVAEMPSEETENNSEDYLEGHILEKTEEGDKKVTDLTSVSTVDDYATGIVTVINESNWNQPLVATTRLLSEEEVLFRTRETINVPAGGSVEVNVKADEPSARGNIGPAKFTIVALWPSSQKLIYGQSSESMTGGEREVTVATQENINQAKDELINELYETALTEIQRKVSLDYPSEQIVEKATYKKVLSEEVDVEPDQEADDFTIATSLQLIAITFNENDLYAYAIEQLKEQLPQDYELNEYPQENLTYTVEQYDIEDQTAIIEVNFSGTSIIELTSSIFDREKIVNQDKQDIKAYFLSYDDIQNVQIKFSPFWVMRAPSLKDHIEIEIAK